MAKAAFYLLCAFVFILPWESLGDLAALPSVGRLMGLATLVIGFMAVAGGARLSRVPAAFYVMVLYLVLYAVSVMWAIDPATTLGGCVTVVCLLALVWLVLEFAPTLDQQLRLMRWYTYGLGAAIVMQLVLFRGAGGPAETDTTRFAGGGHDPNYFSELLSLGAIFCAYLIVCAKHQKRGIPWLYWTLLPVIALSIILTGSRTGFVALLLSGGLLLFVLRSGGWKTIFLFAIVAAGAALLVRHFAPETLMTCATGRIGIDAEDLGSRAEFGRRRPKPLRNVQLSGPAGVVANKPSANITWRLQSHDLFLTVCVELGFVGLSLFLLLLFLLFLATLSMPGTQRKVWLSTLLVWGLFAIFGGNPVDKMMWFLFALILAQGKLFRDRRKATAAARRTMLRRRNYVPFTR